MNIKLVVFDFDGVFTDNHVFVSEDGKESVRCSRADGIGMRMLREAGIGSVVFSQEMNPVVSHRCLKLHIPLFASIDDKLALLDMNYSSVAKGNIAYLGNDLPDLECLQAVGLPACPPDAHPHVVAYCLAHGHVTEAKGGEGCVREFCEYILNGPQEKKCPHPKDELINISILSDPYKTFKCGLCGEKIIDCKHSKPVVVPETRYAGTEYYCPDCEKYFNEEANDV